MEKIPLDTLIDELDFSVRARNGLTRGGLHTLGDILETGYNGVRDCRCIGEKVAKEIGDKLELCGYCLKGFAEHEAEQKLKKETVYRVYGYDKDADTEVFLATLTTYHDAVIMAQTAMRLIRLEMLRNTTGEPFDWVIIAASDGTTYTITDWKETY